MNNALFSLIFIMFSVAVDAAPTSYSSARELMRNVYEKNTKTFYCDCSFAWTEKGSGKIDLSSCGYQMNNPLLNAHRAARLEWEHVVPAYDLYRQRACGRNGGRSNCIANDPAFNAMEGDMHNLVPSIGEVNVDRWNFNFGILAKGDHDYGDCTIEIDRSLRTVEPPVSRRGEIARMYFYMYERYSLSMSNQQQQLFVAWNKLHPVTPAELDRDRRIAIYMGHSNPYVTGQKTWQLKNTIQENVSAVLIRGNKNSGVYHLPTGCPSYDKVSPRNVIEFTSTKDAEDAGFRRAGNCQ